MDEVVMCGICLNMDAKMYKLRGYPLEDYYTWIVGNLLETKISDYFQYVCYECAHYVVKYNAFREKCLRSRSVLIDMLQKKGKLTIDYIKSIDRQKFELCSNLTYGLKNIHTIKDNGFEQDCDIKIENSLLKKVNDIKFEFDLQDEEKNEVITSESNGDQHSFKLQTEVNKTIKMPTMTTKKTSEKNVNNSHKKQRKTEGSGEVTLKKTETELQMPNRKQDPKQNSQTLTTLEKKLANQVKIITFTLEEQLQHVLKRKESPNYINSKYKCNICYKGFIDPDAFNNHMKRHDPGNGSHVCPICKMCFLKKTVYSQHRLQHAKNYACKSCSRICLTITSAKVHVKEHEGKIYICEQCGHVTMKRSSLLGHIRLKHPSDFVCDICGFSFVSELGLKHHKSRHRFKAESERNSVTWMSYCKVCNRHCNSSQTWKQHIYSILHKIKINNGFNCDECNETFKTSEDYRLHRLTHKRRYLLQKRNKSSPKVWPSKCPHCDKMIPTAHQYYFHIRKSHPDKPYPITKNHICDVCGARFTNNTLLQYHIRTHIDGKCFKCTECSKSFSSNTNLNLHKIAHSDARPYSCDICCKAFKTKGNMRKHSKIHTGEKPYSCEYCGKAFGQSSDCRIHTMTVHLKQPAPSISRKRRRAPVKEPAHSL